MGANYFEDKYVGNATMEEALNSLAEDAAWDFGHAGYTGTIAEKGGAVEIAEVETWAEASEVARTADDEAHESEAHNPAQRRSRTYPGYSSDKWGPAGAVKVGDQGWLFFGWASS